MEQVSPLRVLVAMSGGVDSSVAAARLVRAGYEVIGVTLHLWDYPDDGSVRGRCCAPEDQHDARRVADVLGIPHYAFDRRVDFLREVVDPFVEAYLEGETPSPCVACNRGVKMRELFALADRLGARKVATGHYARVLQEGPYRRLARGRDRSKDQSYFLHTLNPSQLERLVLPLGESTKEQVRAEALALGLHGAAKGESHELCFVPNGRYDTFVETRAGSKVRPGPILDASGREVGHHGGVHRFTIGQRKGLGVALGQPVFVVGIDAVRGAIRLGPREALRVGGVQVEEWVQGPGWPTEHEAMVQVRARHEGAEARIVTSTEGNATVFFQKPVEGVSPGQYAVAYAGEVVIGGGRISRTLPSQATYAMEMRP
ncbi:MAG: tRNA 2-thiouridine(34) synthase MnmA [Myxococcales bacterium]|nr:tRNA 2-thiouridine(34) synthase MnmA [Polyangiaceae bacterium]MDW8249347.1 tRNA 2-thiouridine(34) synthase MnmA [Myxococcales bacterium]